LLNSSGQLAAHMIALDIIAHADGAGSITFPAKVAVVVEAPNSSRQYIHDVTVAAADTWERVEITVPIDTSSTVNHGSGQGYLIYVSLYGGSGTQATVDTWQATGRDTVTSSTDNWADATGNYIGFTEVQVEPGDTATTFVNEPIQDTLAKCQRYYNRVKGTDNDYFIAGYTRDTTVFDGMFYYPVTMKSVPSLSHTGVADFKVTHRTTQTVCSAVASNHIEIYAVNIRGTVASGLVAGEGAVMNFTGTGTEWFDLSAEF